MNDPFDLGLVSVDDIKNVFGQLVNRIQFEPVRQDIWMEALENCKYELIKLAQRNTELFKVVHK